MTCPVCGEQTVVYNSATDIECVYRLRICKVCGHRFYTEEVENETARTRLYKIRNERQKENDKG